MPPLSRDSGSACTLRCPAAVQVELKEHVTEVSTTEQMRYFIESLQFSVSEDSPRNCPMKPERDHGVSGHPLGVELVGDIVCIDPAQNQPENEGTFITFGILKS